VRDETSGQVVSFGGVAKILGGLNPNYGNSAPKVMFYSARGPDPEDNSLSNADILKPNLVAPGSSIWGAWSSLGLDSAEFAGNCSFFCFEMFCEPCVNWLVNCTNMERFDQSMFLTLLKWHTFLDEE